MLLKQKKRNRCNLVLVIVESARVELKWVGKYILLTNYHKTQRDKATRVVNLNYLSYFHDLVLSDKNCIYINLFTLYCNLFKWFSRMVTFLFATKLLKIAGIVL